MSGIFRRARFVLPLYVVLGCLAALAFVPTTFSAEDSSDWENRIKLGVRAYEEGENKLAFNTFYSLMSEGNRKFGASDCRMTRMYTNLGAVYDQDHEYFYAEDCLQKGLTLAKRCAGQNSPQTMAALIDLGQVYVHRGKYAPAQPFFKQAIAIADKSGDEHLMPYAAIAEANLGSMFYTAGNFGFGEPHFKRALELATTSLGADHKWTVTIGGMYAACLQAAGKPKEAKAVEQAAMRKANETQTPLATWKQQIALADAAIAEKRASDAESALKRAEQASRDLPAEPMLKALALTRYGDVLLAQNKPALAIQKWKDAQAIADAVLGADDEAVLRHAKQLADLEKTQAQYPDAEPLYRRLVARADKQFGPESPQYEEAVSDLADLYSSWAQYPKAVTYFSKLLALQEKRFGPQSEKLIPTLTALGTAAQNNTKAFSEVNEKAEEYFKRAHSIAEKHYGATARETIAVVDALSHYYQRRLNWDKAVKACLQVVVADEKNFGPDSPETLKALEHYAVVLRAAGLRDKAEPIEARIARMRGIAPVEE